MNARDDERIAAADPKLDQSVLDYLHGQAGTVSTWDVMNNFSTVPIKLLVQSLRRLTLEGKVWSHDDREWEARQ